MSSVPAPRTRLSSACARKSQISRAPSSLCRCRKTSRSAAGYRLGISANLIDQTLYDAFGQRQVATIYTATNQYKVVLEVQPQFQRDPNLLSKIYLASPTGAEVPLSSFAHFVEKT